MEHSARTAWEKESQQQPEWKMQQNMCFMMHKIVFRFSMILGVRDCATFSCRLVLPKVLCCPYHSMAVLPLQAEMISWLS